MTDLTPQHATDATAEYGTPVDDLKPVPLIVRTMTLIFIVVPFIALLVAPFLVWGWGFHWSDLALLSGGYVLTLLGITVGYHRLYTHRSFETHAPVKFVLAALGSMAVQGSLLKWVATHRRHHQHTDKPDDPHTPHHQGGTGVLGVLRGAWHSHMGWFFVPEKSDGDRFVPDLLKSHTARLVSALFPLWVVLGLIVPAILGGLLTGTWVGFWTGLVWGGLVRMFLVHHVTWCVNSACHLWGRRPFKSDDESRNNAVFGVLAMGEGWHNAHHAFPSSARHGLRWWELDISYWVIRAMSLVGLAWNIKIPGRDVLARARR